MRRVARLRWRFKLVGDVLQILSQRTQHVGTDVAAQDNFTVWRYGDNDVWHLKADLLQPQADEDISLGEDVFEGSDDICHRSTLWQVCVRVAGPISSQPPICREHEKKRRPAGSTGGALLLTAIAVPGGEYKLLIQRQRWARVAGLS